MVTEAEIVGVAAIKRFRELVESYRGPPSALKTSLLKKLKIWEKNGDRTLAEAFDELFRSA